jgi:hypothetical protein
MVDEFKIPLQMIKYVDWDRLMKEAMVEARKITIEEIRKGHFEELTGYSFRIEKGE